MKNRKGKIVTHHGLALRTRRVDGELIRHSDDEVVGSAIPRRAGINDLDGHIEDHIRVGIRQRHRSTWCGVQVEIRDV